MVDYRTDPQLIDACLAGDEQAWAQLVERYQRLVYSIALRQGLPPEDADDVFQTVFTILLNKLQTCRDRERLGAWLTTITRREAWRVARGDTAGVEMEGEEALEVHPSPEPAPDLALEKIEEQDIIRQALDRLGDRCRQLLWHLFYKHEPLSYAEIAQELAMPEGSVGPTRARCLERLKGVLGAMGFGGT